MMRVILRSAKGQFTSWRSEGDKMAPIIFKEGQNVHKTATDRQVDKEINTPADTQANRPKKKTRTQEKHTKRQTEMAKSPNVKSKNIS